MTRPLACFGVEVHEDVACFDGSATLVVTALLAFAGHLPYAAADRQISRLHVGGFQLFAFGLAQRGVRSAQQIVHVLAEPRGVPEFKRGAQPARQSIQKILQQRQVALQKGRQLEQHGTQLFLHVQRLQRGDELRGEVATSRGA